jgi:hypothetical protein
MRRFVLLISLAAIWLPPAIASAKLPFFGLEVEPLHPDAGEPILLAFTWFRDQAHTQPSSCGGGTDRSRIAWVHPLDDDGQLDHTDWLPVMGRCTAGALRARIVLEEPGAYDVLPLWRSWPADAGDGFADTIRLEVGRPLRIAPLALAAFGVVGTSLAVAAWRRRRPTGVMP